MFEKHSLHYYSFLASLDVVREILSSVVHMEKEKARPVNQNNEVVKIIEMLVELSTTAVAQFNAEHQHDLAEAAAAQVAILQEYIHKVEEATAADISKAVTETVAKLKEAGTKVHISSVITALKAPGGALNGKRYDGRTVSGVIRAKVKREKIKRKPPKSDI